MDVHVLIDYYNLPQKVLNAGVASLVTQVEALVRWTCPDACEVYVRLYGGWYDASGLSNDGTVVAQEVSNNFPRVVRSSSGAVCRTHCEMASSLIAIKGDPFLATVRDRRGLARLLRTPAPVGCIDAPNCTAPCVIEWSRKGCPTSGCPVSGSEAFMCKQQKLVDILLCCDLITLTSAGPQVKLFLVSEDDDFIPALLLARSFGSNVWHVRTKPNKSRLYDSMLLRNGIRVTFI
jgi:hypothetical protein